jgi:hypothetical protein
MATTEPGQELEASGGVDRAQPSLRVAVSAESSASPKQILAAGVRLLRAASAEMENVKTKRLEVQERGDDWAEVTEGTMIVGVFWERMPLRLVSAGNGDRHRARLERLSTGGPRSSFAPGRGRAAAAWSRWSSPVTSATESRARSRGPSTTSRAGACSGGICAPRSRRSSEPRPSTR